MPNKDITLSHKTRIRGISLIKAHKAFTISSRRITHINLFSKEQYIAQQARKVYLGFVY